MSHVPYHISSIFIYTHTDLQDMRYVPIHGTPACIRLNMETIVYMLVACGIAQANMETMTAEFAMYWQETPSVETGVLLAEWQRSTNRCSPCQPSQQPIKLTASARMKEESHTSKEGKAGLQTAPLHRHAPWCYLWHFSHSPSSFCSNQRDQLEHLHHHCLTFSMKWSCAKTLAIQPCC